MDATPDSIGDWLRRFGIQVTEEWGHLGTMVTPSGTRLVGHVPQVAPAAWLFSFYAGCADAQLDAWEERMRTSIPPPWREVLRNLNGLTMLVRIIHLCGVLSPRGLVSRDWHDPSPMSLDYAVDEPPRGPVMSSTDFLVGSEVGREYDRGSVYCLRGGAMLRVSRDGQTEKARWPSISSMLEAEYRAFSEMHDSDGTFRAPWDTG
jgi:hypothetical protein